MFDSIAQGLNLYKSEIMAFLQKQRLLHKEYREAFDARGGPGYYQGILDWSEDDYKWIIAAEQMLNGMEKALGLTESENDETWRAVGFSPKSASCD